MKWKIDLNKPVTLLVILFAIASCDEQITELEPIKLVPLERSELSPKSELGRVLFYDKHLSINNSVSCESCHKQNLAFSDNVAFSRGVENVLTSRNSMPIQNLGSGNFVESENFLFWDGRETSLKSMVLKPITNHIEMGITDLEKLSVKLSKLPYYQELFDNAFIENEITPDNISSALSSFLREIKSNDTKFDRHLFSQESLTVLEQEGLELFNKTYECNSCHQVQDPKGYLTSGVFANIGLDKEYTDSGLMSTSSNSSDNGKFKIPSLRNIEVTGPYMHDGRFETLEEVMDHYSSGIKDNENLDFRLRNENGQPLRQQINNNDKKAIIAFLNTLTDHTMISDSRFSNPFSN